MSLRNIIEKTVQYVDESIETQATDTQSTYVPLTRTINSKPLSANITLTASDVGAVPTSRTINNIPMSDNITLSASDVGALPNTTVIPTVPNNISAFTNDSGYITTTALDGYLPLTAGSEKQLSGDLYFSPYAGSARTGGVVRSNDNGLSIQANTNSALTGTNGGAYLQLNDEYSYSTAGGTVEQGQFVLAAKNGLATKLIGRTNGSLTWGGNSLALAKDYLPLIGGTITGNLFVSNIYYKTATNVDLSTTSTSARETTAFNVNRNPDDTTHTGNIFALHATQPSNSQNLEVGIRVANPRAGNLPTSGTNVRTNNCWDKVGLRYNYDLNQAYAYTSNPPVLDASDNRYFANHLATVGNLKTALNDYLPLSGGTMTGTINGSINGTVNGSLSVVTTNNRVFSLVGDTTTSYPDYTNIDFGWNWNNMDGAGLGLRSVDHDTLPGYFSLYARDATNHATLDGTPDGRLTWSGGNGVELKGPIWRTYTSLQKGTNPSSTMWHYDIGSMDKNGTTSHPSANRLGEVRGYVDSNGSSAMEMLAYDFTADSTANNTLTVMKLLNGNRRTNINSNLVRIENNMMYKGDSDTSWIRISGGNGDNKGGSLLVYGQTASGTNAGRSVIRSYNGTNILTIDMLPVDNHILCNSTLVLTKTQDMSGTADNGPALCVGGARTSTHMEMDCNEIQAKATGTTTAPIYINPDGSAVYVGNGTAGVQLNASNAFQPRTTKKLTLGAGSYLWTTVYANTATISTSDARQKQQIAEIPEEILDAWENVSWKQFKMNDSVEEKGDSAARLHTGVVAQEVDDVFKEKGLDPRKYGFFCYDSWEAKEAVTQGDKVMEPALEAGNAYAIRYEEALCIEVAYLRRKLKRMEQLEERLRILEEKLGL